VPSVVTAAQRTVLLSTLNHSLLDESTQHTLMTAVSPVGKPPSVTIFSLSCHCSQKVMFVYSHLLTCPAPVMCTDGDDGLLHRPIRTHCLLILQSIYLIFIHLCRHTKSSYYATQTSAATASEICRRRTRTGMLTSASGLSSVVRLNIYTKHPPPAELQTAVRASHNASYWLHTSPVTAGDKQHTRLVKSTQHSRE